ncbi:MAG TPA: hypothetical protein VGF17_22170 [Phytomonospora sp.]
MNAVEEILALVAIFREYGVVVEFEPGWETRGNGLAAAYEGGVLHHTAIPASYANPGPGTRVLRDGRPDLDGPLCNLQNKFNGVVRVIAAHPANHAGAGAGPSMGPLPRTRLFNPRVVGMENDYAGNTPMSPEQYRTSQVYAIAIKRRYGSVERCRLHAETSEEGKWDAGWKPSTPIDAAAFRRDALALEATGGVTQEAEDDVMFQTIPLDPTAPDEKREVIIGLPWQGGTGGVKSVNATIGAGNKPMKIGVAHFRVVENGGNRPVGMVDDGTVLEGLTDTGGVDAPKNSRSLVIDYTAELGGFVVIEASR